MYLLIPYINDSLTYLSNGYIIFSIKGMRKKILDSFGCCFLQSKKNGNSLIMIFSFSTSKHMSRTCQECLEHRHLPVLISIMTWEIFLIWRQNNYLLEIQNFQSNQFFLMPDLMMSEMKQKISHFHQFFSRHRSNSLPCHERQRQ